MKKSVTISRTHIRLGKRSQCLECPVAIAMGAHVKPNVAVSIGHAFGFWINGGDGRLLETPIPGEVLDWACKYDKNYHMEPFTFEAEIPDEAAA